MAAPVSEASTPAVQSPATTCANNNGDLPEKLSIEDLRKFISLLSKEQLVELAATAAVAHSDVYAVAHEQVQASPASRRLMIRNISYSTTDEAYFTFLSQFGEIEDAVICRNPSGKSKGFGFATFKYVESVKSCLEANATLDGRPLHAKLAADIYADFSQGGRQLPDAPARRKLFIRNLADSTDSGTLHNEFLKYGEIEESVVVTDAEGKSRGYGFVTFANADSSAKAVQHPQRVINGRIAFVSFAIPKNLKPPRDIGVSVEDDLTFRSYGGPGANMQAASYPTYPYLIDPLQAAAAANALSAVAGLSNRGHGHMGGGRMSLSPLSQSVTAQASHSQALNGYYAAAQAAYLAQAQSQGGGQPYALGYPTGSGSFGGYDGGTGVRPRPRR